ncbi:MAG: signal peptidase I [Desulfobacteraceae bacterium]|nr:MAG: signal peptidase I [Desulfobacteraceae bacterium]
MKADPTKKAAVSAKPTKGKLRENIEALVIAVILALFIRSFIVQAFKIPSGSMQNTLLVGDYILVNKFIYGLKIPFTDVTVIPIKEPKRGDIVVFKFPEDPSKDFIKRVVAVGGDSVAIQNKKLYVNGELQENQFAIHSDPHIYPPGFQFRDNFGPIKVPEGKLFVMGDNRDESNDSRFWGFVDVSALKGKAFLIYWSWDKEDFDVRWGRLGHLIR